MEIIEFKDGSVLHIGSGEELSRLLNLTTPNYNVCEHCVNGDNDEICEDCSVNGNSGGCSCHVDPPCSFCENSKFEMIPTLVPFEVIRQNDTKIIRFFKMEENYYHLYKDMSDRLKFSVEQLFEGEYVYIVGNKDDIFGMISSNTRNDTHILNQLVSKAIEFLKLSSRRNSC